MTTKELNRRLTRWWEELSSFDLKIIHTPGKDNAQADALSRRADYEENQKVFDSILLPNEDGTYRINQYIELTERYDLKESIKQTYKNDTVAQQVLQSKTPIKHFRYTNGLVYFKGRIYIPSDQKLRNTILQIYHDAPTSGHQGIEKTIERIRRTYYWPGMTSTVKEYIASCDSCFRNKAHRHKEYGKLQSLPTLTKPGQQITLDFVTGLPNSNDPTTGVSYDGILSVVERLNKYTWFIPWKSQWDAKEFAQIFLQKLYPEIGVPKATITDRDTKFTSTFWQMIAKETGINTKMSSAYHPQTDGQTERANQTVQQYLRAYVDYRQTNWVQYLPLAQFAYNSSVNETTKMTPHYARYGHELESYRGQYENTNVSDEGLVTATTWKHIVETLKDEIDFQNQRRKQYYDNKRHAEPSLKKGDEVYLLRRNIKTK